MTWAANELRAKGRILIDLTYNGRGICRVDADQAGELMDLLRDRFTLPDSWLAVLPPPVPERQHICELPNRHGDHTCEVCGTRWHNPKSRDVFWWKPDPTQPQASGVVLVDPWRRGRWWRR